MSKTVNEIQRDWETREFVSGIHHDMVKIVAFLNRFEKEARYKLAIVNEQLSSLERTCDFVDKSLKHVDPRERDGKPSPLQGSTFDKEVRMKAIQEKKDKVAASQGRIITKRVPAKGQRRVIANIRLNLGKKETPKPKPVPAAPAAPPVPARKEKSSDLKAPPAPSGPPKRPPPTVAEGPPEGPPPRPVVKSAAPPGPPARPPGAGPRPPVRSGPPGGAPPPIRNSMREAMGVDAVPGPPKKVPGPPKKVPGPPTKVPGPPSNVPGPPPKVPGPPPAGPPKVPGPPPAGPPKVPGPPGAVPGPPAMVPGPPPKKPAVPGPPPTGPPAPAEQPGDDLDEEEGSSEYESDPEMPVLSPPPPKPLDDVWIQRVSPGGGARPGPASKVVVDYTGWLFQNGECFDSSDNYDISIGSGDTIEGLETVLQRMQAGERVICVIPSKLGYGAEGAGEGMIPPNADLMFDLTLTSIDG